MPARFEWVTEDEESPQDNQGDSVAVPRRRTRIDLLVALIFAGLTVLLIRQAILERVESALTAVEADVLATHELVQQAARDFDVELLGALLSGRDPTWASAQKSLVEEGLLFAAPQLGLVGSTIPPAVQSISLKPDLRQAELQTLWRYHSRSLSQETETVSLLRTDLYRRGESRWFFAPPDDAFWGTWQTSESGRFSMTYPQRDAEIIQRLDDLLRDRLEESCRLWEDLNCPAELRVELLFDTDPATLGAVSKRERVVGGGRRLTLPAPTLFGRPMDEGSTQFLLKGYASLVFSALIPDLVGWQCCHRGLFFLALLDAQLEELGLQPWPLGSADYEGMLATLTNIYDQSRLWHLDDIDRATSEQLRDAYAIVEYVLAASPEVSAVALQRALIKSNSYLRWLNQYAPTDFSSVAMRDGWPRYIRRKGAWLSNVYAKSLSGQKSEPDDLPKQDVLLSCRTPERGFSRGLYRYDPGLEEWEPIVTEGSITSLAALPGDEGIVFERENAGRLEIVVWQDGIERLVYSQPLDNLEGLRSSGLVDPSGRFLLLERFQGERRANLAPLGQAYTLLGMEACHWPNCRLQPLPGLPIWSPDGSKMLAMRTDGPHRLDTPAELLLIDGEGGQTRGLGRGSWPFWLDDDTVGYLRQGSEVVLYSTTENTVTTAITVNDLLAQVPRGLGLDSLLIDGLISGPHDGRLLAITSNGNSGKDSLHLTFLYEGRSDRLSLRVHLKNVETRPPRFSPDGRWLMVRTSNPVRRPSSLPYSLFFYDIQRQEMATVVGWTFTQPDWSRGGGWLLRYAEGFLDFIAPELDMGDGLPYHRLIVHDYLRCRQAVWVNRY